MKKLDLKIKLIIYKRLTFHIFSEYMKRNLFTMNDPHDLSVLLMHVSHKPYKI